jgi:hypothetical protein
VSGDQGADQGAEESLSNILQKSADGWPCRPPKQF